MKRYSSVFEMIARSSIYKVLAILGGMVIAEAISCYTTFFNEAPYYKEVTPDMESSLAAYIGWTDFEWIFKIAYVLITIVILLSGMNLGSTQSYTLQRLRIKEKRIFWLQTLYNTLAYVLLWGTQLVVILVSVLVYQNNLPKGEVWNNQSLFLAAYQNKFLHSILPLEDGPGWWILGFVMVGTGFFAAEVTRLQRCGKFAIEILIWVVAVVFFFPREVGYEFTPLVVALVVALIIMGMRRLLNMEVDES